MLANTDPEIATNTQHTQMQENSTQKQAETSLGQDPQQKKPCENTANHTLLYKLVSFSSQFCFTNTKFKPKREKGKNPKNSNQKGNF
jgi:hypothetical protein